MANSLLSQLSRFENPEPSFVDPEDDEDVLAGIESKLAGDDDHEDEVTPHDSLSKLRSRNAPLLSEKDRKYGGKITSRRKIHSDGAGVSDSDGEMNDRAKKLDAMLNDNDDENEATNSDGGVASDASDDLDLAAFQNEIKHKIKQASLTDNTMDEDKEEEGDGDGDTEEGGDDGDGDTEEGDDGDEDEEEDDDEMADSESGSGGSDNDNGDLSTFADRFQSGSKPQLVSISSLTDGIEGAVDQDNADVGDIAAFSKPLPVDEVARGRAVQTQLALWDSLLEGRIRLQKVVSLVNRLPHPDQWSLFKENGGSEFKATEKLCKKRVVEMLASMVELQTLIMEASTRDSSDVTVSQGVADEEEITSEEEVAVDDQTDAKQAVKRKLPHQDYRKCLGKRHSGFKRFRNNVIEKWSEKTRLASGKFNSKAFSAFDQSAVKQIEQITSDRARLVARTKVKRSTYRVLGTPEAVEVIQAEPDDIDDMAMVTREVKQDVDPEIFDDTDFYHQLLTQLIQRKCTDTSDPAALTRHMILIQRLRSKVKRDVDTGASKGRKLRYNVHSKMVSFMAPVDTSEWTHASRDDLFKSLFGRQEVIGSDEKATKPSADSIRII